MKKCKFVLVSAANIVDCFDHCLMSTKVAVDTETTGLDTRVFSNKTVETLVGVCLSPDGVTGYYIPLAHKGAGAPYNVSWSLFAEQFRRLSAAMAEGKLVMIFHNATYDQEILEYTGDSIPLGTWDNPLHWDDTQLLAYLSDSTRKRLGLKPLSLEICQMEQIELGQLFSEQEKNTAGFTYDFSSLDPSWWPVVWYAAGDALATWRLHGVLKPRIDPGCPETNDPNQSMVYFIERMCVIANRWMMRGRIKLDLDRVMELIISGQKDWFKAITVLYEEAQNQLGRDVMPGKIRCLLKSFESDNPDFLLDKQLELAKTVGPTRFPDPKGLVTKGEKGYPYVYDVLSPQQLGTMFEEMSIPGLTYTEKSGQVQTSKDVLEKLLEDLEETYPFMARVRRFREVSGALSKYLLPMLRDHEPTDHTIKIQYKQLGTDTGRFATPTQKDGANEFEADKDALPGSPKINFQAIPSLKDKKKRAECLYRMRECIVARDVHRVIVSCDFSAVEVRIVCNISGEEKWIGQFFKCSDCEHQFPRVDPTTNAAFTPPPRCPTCGSDKIGDVHSLTAISVYGEEARKQDGWKDKRGNAKSLNFAMCYGGGPSAAMRAVKCDKQEGQRIKATFDRTYVTLKRWWDQQHATARRYKYVLSGFGRKLMMHDIDHAESFFRSKAERNSVNAPIQSTSADMTKLAMGLIYRECKNRGWLDKCQLIITMHDELVFDVDLSIVEEAIEVFRHCMVRNKFIRDRKWTVPYTSDVEIGHSYMVPFDLNACRQGEVRWKGDKKFDSAEAAAAAGVDWDTAPRFPATLAPHFRFQTFDGLASATATWIAGGKVDKPVPQPIAQQTITVVPASAAPSPLEITPVSGNASQAVLCDTTVTPMPERQNIDEEEDKPPMLKPGEVYTYRLRAPLNTTTLFKLSQTIFSCRGRGTKPLRLEDTSGNEITDWAPAGMHIMVHEQEFFFSARQAGI